jgi:hypothetical protein
MPATTEVTPAESASLAEAREAAFDAARDLQTLQHADQGATYAIDTFDEDSRVTRKTLDAAIGGLLPRAGHRLQALVGEHRRELCLGTLPPHVRDEFMSRADDVVRLGALRKAAGTLPDDAFSRLPLFVAQERIEKARAVQRRLASEVGEARRAAQRVTGLLDAVEKIEAKQPGLPPDSMLTPSQQAAMRARTPVGADEREAFEVGRQAELLALQPLLEDATAKAVELAERVRTARAEVDAALHGKPQHAADEELPAGESER